MSFTQGFDYPAFWDRICVYQLDGLKIGEMSKQQVTDLVDAVALFLPRQCIHCGQYEPDSENRGRRGICGIDGHMVQDCLGNCPINMDMVPF